MIEKIDMMGQEMLMNAKDAINNIEDLKIKLHADNTKLSDAVDDLTDKEQSIQNNIKILGVQNDKIRAQIK